MVAEYVILMIGGYVWDILRENQGALKDRTVDYCRIRESRIIASSNMITIKIIISL
jgi:hypothetical protein